MSAAPLSRTGLALVLIAVFLWAGNFVFVRAAVGVVPPMAIAFYRWIVASGIAIALAWPYLRQDMRTILRNWRILFLLGAFGIGGNSGFMFYGLQSTTAINAVLMNSVSPLLVAILTFVFFGERPQRRTLVGLLFAILGVVWVIIGGDIHALLSLHLNAGDFWVLMGVASYAVYMAFLRKAPAMRDVSLNAVTFLFGTLPLLPLFLMEHAGGARTDWGQPIGWIAILYMAAGSSVVSYLCFNKAIRLIGATRASAFLLLTPLMGSLFAVALIGETLTSAHVVGAALIFTGLFIGRR